MNKGIVFRSFQTRGAVIRPRFWCLCWSLMTKTNKHPKNTTDSAHHCGANQYLVRATHSILDPWDRPFCSSLREQWFIQRNKVSVYPLTDAPHTFPLNTNLHPFTSVISSGLFLAGLWVCVCVSSSTCVILISPHKTEKSSLGSVTKFQMTGLRLLKRSL